jgi:hypothetical protein
MNFLIVKYVSTTAIHNIKLSHTYEVYAPTTSVIYSYVQDFFAQITDTTGNTKFYYGTKRGESAETILGFRIRSALKSGGMSISASTRSALRLPQIIQFVPIKPKHGEFLRANTFHLTEGTGRGIRLRFSSPVAVGLGRNVRYQV